MSADGATPPPADERPILPAVMLSLAFGGAVLFLVIGVGLRSPPASIMDAASPEPSPSEASSEPVDAGLAESSDAARAATESIADAAPVPARPASAAPPPSSAAPDAGKRPRRK